MWHYIRPGDGLLDFGSDIEIEFSGATYYSDFGNSSGGPAIVADGCKVWASVDIWFRNNGVFSEYIDVKVIILAGATDITFSKRVELPALSYFSGMPVIFAKNTYNSFGYADGTKFNAKKQIYLYSHLIGEDVDSNVYQLAAAPKLSDIGFTLISVAPENYVLPGGTISTRLRWNNKGVLLFAPQFAVATQRGGSWDSRIQGGWIEGGSLGRDGVSGQKTATVVVPDNWAPGEELDLAIYVQAPGFFGPTRIWTENDYLRIPKVNADDIAVTLIGVSAG